MNNDQPNNFTTWDYVRAYTDLGFVCLPVKKGTKRPDLASWISYKTRKPTQEQLEEWFIERDVGVAIVTGEVSSLTVVDSDSYHPDAARLTLETPLVAKTGNGGRHYYFRNAANIPAFKNHELHVEALTDGAIVIAPPTIHPNGSRYEWTTPLVEHVNQLPPCPADILKYAPARQKGKFDWKKALNVQQGARDETIYRAANSLVAKKFEFETALAILRGVNSSYVPPLEDSEVIKKLRNALLYVEGQSISKDERKQREENTKKWRVGFVNTQLTHKQQEAIDELRKCNYRTPPFEIAQFLGVIFQDCGTEKASHWTYVASHWPPRPILRTIDFIEKKIHEGIDIKISKAAWFTSELRFRKPRRQRHKVMVAVDSINSLNKTQENDNRSVEKDGVFEKRTVEVKNMLSVNYIKPIQTREKNYHVSYNQLTPIERYYFIIADRGAEEGYCRRLVLRGGENYKK